MRHIMLSHGKDAKPFIDGIVGPAHVSAVIGEMPYREFVDEWKIPVVICGFEPLDMLLSILMLVRQTNAGVAKVENEFTRAVPAEGNRLALSLMAETFVLRESFAWRGLGRLPSSALALSPAYEMFDAEKRFNLIEHDVPDNKACECGAILRGEKEPRDCKAFGTVCTPVHPIGACMVSSEGACAAYFSYESRRAA
jgi:hydrogenase expression/formation protein HypD